MDAWVKRIESMRSKLTALRRAVHQWPELGFREERTSALIRKELAGAKVPHRRMAGTGTVALVRGARPGKTVLIRADIDALPIAEQNALPYRSRRVGVMHA
jgi:metal-dependent amidase/aminoacylase/carboxypeptidase family protein